MRMSCTPSPQVINDPSLRRKEIVGEVYGLCYFHVQQRLLAGYCTKYKSCKLLQEKGIFASDEKGRGQYSHPVVARLLMVMITDLQLHVLVLSK